VRALLRVPTTLRHTFGDEDGDPTPPGGAVTVAVVDGAGTAVAGSPFTASSVPESVAGATYTATLPARTQADVLTLTWRVAGTAVYEDRLELVACRLVDLWKLRRDKELATIPAEELQDVAEAVEDELAEVLHYSPFLRGGRFTVSVSGVWGERLMGLPPWVQEVYGVTLDGEAQDVTTFTIAPAGYLSLTSGAAFTSGTYSVWCLYGKRPTTEAVRRATMLARYRARQPRIPERASVVNTESGTITLFTPNAQFPTGLPEVDGWIRRNREIGVLV
jgi:hypothetical protein